MTATIEKPGGSTIAGNCSAGLCCVTDGYSEASHPTRPVKLGFVNFYFLLVSLLVVLAQRIIGAVRSVRSIPFVNAQLIKN